MIIIIVSKCFLSAIIYIRLFLDSGNDLLQQYDRKLFSTWLINETNCKIPDINPKDISAMKFYTKSKSKVKLYIVLPNILGREDIYVTYLIFRYETLY